MKHATGTKSVRSAFCALALVLATGSSSLASEPPERVVDINRASAQELTSLPGVGAVRAGAIVALREHRGGFVAIDELADVEGIGAALLGQLRPYVRLDGGPARVR